MMEAVAGTVADLGLIPAEAETESPSSETAAAPPAQEAAIDYNPTLPDDLAELLDEPDLTEIDEEVAPDEYADPDELARELAKTRRLLEHERTQRITVSRKAWETEAKKFFPLADLTGITADSRRGFLRKAKEQHGRNYLLLKPQLDELAAQKKAADAALAANTRAGEANKWGPPVIGAGGPPPSTTADERLVAARRSKNLKASVRALLDNGTV